MEGLLAEFLVFLRRFTDLLPLLKKLLISLFIVLNLFTVLFTNRPTFVIEAANRVIKDYNSPAFAYKLGLYAWYIKYYAHIVGLNNRWQMFGRQSRFNWWYKIKAEYARKPNTIASQVVLLPLPRQTKRTFLQSEFIDFKEGKFHLILYSDPVGRHIYSRYLCRQYPEYKGAPIGKIIFEINYQYILPPKEANLKGTHLHPTISKRIISEFECPRVKS